MSDLAASFEWFGRVGWAKRWDWTPPDTAEATFGAVGSGCCEIFLCRDGQGGRGRGPGIGGDGEGVWMTIWVDDVDAVHAGCLQAGVEVLMAPQDEPWGVREMHLRHPDGHVFRISRGVDPDHSHDHEHPDEDGHSHPH